jgi:hypothetical protein
MKIVFLVYHDILDDRINAMMVESEIDFYTKWENVKGKGHLTDAHLGTRTFPGLNSVRMLALADEGKLPELIQKVEKMNAAAFREDDKVRLFQMPLERIV